MINNRDAIVVCLVFFLIGFVLGGCIALANNDDWNRYLTKHRAQLVELGYGKYKVDNFGNTEFVLIKSGK